MNDDELRRLIDEYAVPAWDRNPKMSGVEIVWERNNPRFGSLHIWLRHNVTEDEVEQALMEEPPYVESTRHPHNAGRTVFWGATRFDRWIIVVCEDWESGGVRYLRPITAFEPTEGLNYWKRMT